MSMPRDFHSARRRGLDSYKENEDGSLTKKGTVYDNFFTLAKSLEEAEIHVSASRNYIQSAKNSIDNLKKYLTLAEVDINTAEECVMESGTRLQRLKAELQSLFNKTFYQNLDLLPVEAARRDEENNIQSSAQTPDGISSPDHVSFALQRYAVENDINLKNYSASYERHGDAICILVTPRTTTENSILVRPAGDPARDGPFHQVSAPESRVKIADAVTNGADCQGKHSYKKHVGNFIKDTAPVTKTPMKQNSIQRDLIEVFISSPSSDTANVNKKTTTQNDCSCSTVFTSSPAVDPASVNAKTATARTPVSMSFVKHIYIQREPEEVPINNSAADLTKINTNTINQSERKCSLELGCQLMTVPTDESSFEKVNSEERMNKSSYDDYSKHSKQLNSVKGQGKPSLESNQTFMKLCPVCRRTPANCVCFETSNDKALRFGSSNERRSANPSEKYEQLKEGILITLSSDSDDEHEVFTNKNKIQKEDEDIRQQIKCCYFECEDLIKKSFQIKSCDFECEDLIKMSSSSGGSENIQIEGTNRDTNTDIIQMMQTDANTESYNEDHTNNCSREKRNANVPKIYFPSEEDGSCRNKTFFQCVLENSSNHSVSSDHKERFHSFDASDSSTQEHNPLLGNGTEFSMVHSEQLHTSNRSTSSNSTLTGCPSNEHSSKQLKVDSKGMGAKCYSGELYPSKMRHDFELKCFSTPQYEKRRHTITNEKSPGTLNQTFHLGARLGRPESVPGSPPRNIAEPKRWYIARNPVDSSSSDETSSNAAEHTDRKRSRSKTSSESPSYVSFNHEISHQGHELLDYDSASASTTIDMSFDSETDNSLCPTVPDSSYNADISGSIYVHISEESINSRSRTFNASLPSSSQKNQFQCLNLSDSAEPFLTTHNSAYGDEFQSESPDSRRDEECYSTMNIYSRSFTDFHSGRKPICYTISKPILSRNCSNSSPEPDYTP